MNKIILVVFSMIIIGSCSDPNTLGINVHPPSDNIIIGSTSSSSWQDSQTESEDSFFFVCRAFSSDAEHETNKNISSKNTGWFNL